MLIQTVRFEYTQKNGAQDVPVPAMRRRIIACPSRRPVAAFEYLGPDGRWQQDALHDVPPFLLAALGGLVAGAGMAHLRWRATAKGDTLTVDLGELDGEPFSDAGIGPEGALKMAEVRGLARCAALLEQAGVDGAAPTTDGDGGIWDSECREAIMAARRAGLIGPRRPAKTATTPLHAACNLFPTGRTLLAVSAGRDGSVTLAFDGGTSVVVGIDSQSGCVAVWRTSAGSPYPLPTNHATLDDHLVNAIANDRAAYHVDPADAIRHARSLAQEVRRWRDRAVACRSCADRDRAREILAPWARQLATLPDMAEAVVASVKEANARCDVGDSALRRIASALGANASDGEGAGWHERIANACVRAIATNNHRVYSLRVARTRDILLPWGGGDQLMKLPDLAQRVVDRLQRSEARNSRSPEVDTDGRTPADRATSALASIANALGVTISIETPWIENARTVIINAISRLADSSGTALLSLTNICRRLGCVLPKGNPEAILAASGAAMSAIDHLTEERDDANSSWAAQVEQTNLMRARMRTALDDISVAVGLASKIVDGEHVGSEQWTATATAAITRAAGKIVTGMRDAAEMEETWHQRCREAENLVSAIATKLGVERSTLKSPWVDSARAAIFAAVDRLTLTKMQQRYVDTLESNPIPMRLVCPGTKADGSPCARLHIDTGEFATRLHHTHACQFCGHVWRPAIVHTVGVEFLPGFRDPAGSDSETRSA